MLDFIKTHYPEQKEHIAWLEHLKQRNPWTTSDTPQLLFDLFSNKGDILTVAPTQQVNQSESTVNVLINNNIKALHVIEGESSIDLIPRWIKNHDVLMSIFTREITWEPDQYKPANGQPIVTNRWKAYMADDPTLEYQYSGLNNTPQSWHPVAKELRDRLQTKLGATFNAALFVYYPNGQTGLAYHSDDEKSIVPNSTIVSLSLGMSRPIYIRRRGDRAEYTDKVTLTGGCLFIMKGTTQRTHEHSIPKLKGTPSNTSDSQARIAITFRHMRP
jgi:alkylated DNA repair dioxygenase AlkB